ATGRDWRRILLSNHTHDRASALVQSLEMDASCPTREDKARRFMEAMRGEDGASRATYFRIRRKLEREGRLVVEQVAPVPLRQPRRPGPPPALDLSIPPTLPPATLGADEAPRDISARQEFAQPVRGNAGPGAPARPVLNDLMP